MRFSSHISQQSAAVLSHGKYSMNLHSFNRYFSEIPSNSLHSFNVIYVMLRHLLAQFPGESIGWSTGQSGRHEQCQHRICWDVLTWSFWNSKSVGSKTCLKVRKHLLLGRSVSSWFFILFLCNLSPMSLSGEDPEFRSGLPLNFSHIMGSWCAGWNAIQPKWLKCDFDIPWFSVLHLFRLAAVSPGTSSGAACFKFVVLVTVETAIWISEKCCFYCIFGNLSRFCLMEIHESMRHFCWKNAQRKKVKVRKAQVPVLHEPASDAKRKASWLACRTFRHQDVNIKKQDVKSQDVMNFTSGKEIETCLLSRNSSIWTRRFESPHVVTFNFVTFDRFWRRFRTLRSAMKWRWISWPSACRQKHRCFTDVQSSIHIANTKDNWANCMFSKKWSDVKCDMS